MTTLLAPSPQHHPVSFVIHRAASSVAQTVAEDAHCPGTHQPRYAGHGRSPPAGNEKQSISEALLDCSNFTRGKCEREM